MDKTSRKTSNVSTVSLVRRSKSALLFSIESLKGDKYDYKSSFANYKFRKLATSIIVEDCIHQLNVVISKYLSVTGNLPCEPLVYKTLNQRFADLLEYKSCLIGVVQSDFHKMQKEVKKIIFVLEEFIDEIIVFSDPRCIDIFVTAYHKMMEEEERFLQEVRRKENIVCNLRKELWSGKINAKKKLKEIEKAIDVKYAELKDMSEYTDTAKSYATQWELSRKEQNLLILKNRENEYISEIASMKNKMRKDDGCHETMMTFLTDLAEDYKAKIHIMMEEYDNEMERREIENYEMKRKLETLRYDRWQLELKYQERARVIQECLEYRRIRKEKEEEVLLENFAATRIQAWWRGEMYRKKLGPYRKKVKKNKIKFKEDKKDKKVKKGKSKK